MGTLDDGRIAMGTPAAFELRVPLSNNKCMKHVDECIVSPQRAHAQTLLADGKSNIIGRKLSHMGP